MFCAFFFHWPHHQHHSHHHHCEPKSIEFDWLEAIQCQSWHNSLPPSSIVSPSSNQNSSIGQEMSCWPIKMVLSLWPCDGHCGQTLLSFCLAHQPPPPCSTTHYWSVINDHSRVSPRVCVCVCLVGLAVTNNGGPLTNLFSLSICHNNWPNIVGTVQVCRPLSLSLSPSAPVPSILLVSQSTPFALHLAANPVKSIPIIHSMHSLNSLKSYLSSSLFIHRRFGHRHIRWQ